MKGRIYIVIFVLCSLFVGTTRAKEYSVPLQESMSGNKHLVAYADGVKVRFTFDTGCSSLTINKTLFEELVRKGMVKWSDLSDLAEAELANGEMHDVRYFTIKRLQIGDYTMRNVRASLGVNDRADADPLLGQGVLNRFNAYLVQDGKLYFDPRPEEMQQAMYFSDIHHSDTTFAVNQQIVNKLQPYINQLGNRYRIIYGQALEYTNREDIAIPLYRQMLNGGAFEDEDHSLFQRKLNAMVNYAEQLYHAERYTECKEVLLDLKHESQLPDPVYERGLRYAHSTLCYVYWQTKEYDQAEKATMDYVEYVVAPHEWRWLLNHKIAANDDLVKLLRHLAKWYRYNDNEEKAQQFDKMAKNAE